MKKSIIINTLIALSLAASLALTSCHDNIYGMILEEVPLETYGISGHITNIVRYNCGGEESIFLTNGRVYKRTAAPSTKDESTWNKQWEKTFDPSSDSTWGSKIAYLAADSNYLYAISTSFKVSNTGYNIEKERHLLCSTDGKTWTEIDVSSMLDRSGYDEEKYYQYDTSVLALNLIFSNNATASADRNAYVRLNNSGVYKLNGTSAPTAVSSNGADGKSNSCTYFKGADYFSVSYELSNNGTYIYFSNNGKNLLYANAYDSTNGLVLSGTTEPGKVTTGTGAIYAVSVTADYVILGTVSGIYHVELETDATPKSTTSSFTTNAKTIFSSTYQVFPILVMDPTAAETETDIFAASSIKGSYSTSTHGLFDDTGLYSYYPSRGYWNKDGTSDKNSKGN